MTTRRGFSDKFKATVAPEALRGDKTAQEKAAKHKVHPTQVSTWKWHAIDGLTGVFSDKASKAEDTEADIKISMDGSGRYLDNIFINVSGDPLSKRPSISMNCRTGSKPNA